MTAPCPSHWSPVRICVRSSLVGITNRLSMGAYELVIDVEKRRGSRSPLLQTTGHVGVKGKAWLDETARKTHPAGEQTTRPMVAVTSAVQCKDLLRLCSRALNVIINQQQPGDDRGDAMRCDARLWIHLTQHCRLVVVSPRPPPGNRGPGGFSFQEKKFIVYLS